MVDIATVGIAFPSAPQAAATPTSVDAMFGMLLQQATDAIQLTGVSVDASITNTQPLSAATVFPAGTSSLPANADILALLQNPSGPPALTEDASVQPDTSNPPVPSALQSQAKGVDQKSNFNNGLSDTLGEHSKLPSAGDLAPIVAHQNTVLKTVPSSAVEVTPPGIEATATDNANTDKPVGSESINSQAVGADAQLALQQASGVQPSPIASQSPIASPQPPNTQTAPSAAISSPPVTETQAVESPAPSVSETQTTYVTSPSPDGPQVVATSPKPALSANARAARPTNEEDGATFDGTAADQSTTPSSQKASAGQEQSPQALTDAQRAAQLMTIFPLAAPVQQGAAVTSSASSKTNGEAAANSLRAAQIGDQSAPSASDANSKAEQKTKAALSTKSRGSADKTADPTIAGGAANKQSADLQASTSSISSPPINGNDAKPVPIEPVHVAASLGNQAKGPADPTASPLPVNLQAAVDPTKVTAKLEITTPRSDSDVTSTLDKLGLTIAARSSEGLHHFDIRLDPADLGRVQVRLTVDDSGQAQATLIADKQHTLDLLQRDSSSLNRALQDAGLNLTNNGLNFSLREQYQQNDSSGQGRRRALSAAALVSSETSQSRSSLGSYAPNSVRLDIRV